MKLPERLISKSTLTPTQVESLASHLEVMAHHASLRQAAAARSTKPVTIGSYFRTVQQGRENIRSSITTVIIAFWLGFVKREDLLKLLNQMNRGLSELETEEKDRAITIIEELISKIVM